MLPAKGRNPKIIGWNRFSRLSQLNMYLCVVMRGLLGKIQHSTINNQGV